MDTADNTALTQCETIRPRRAGASVWLTLALAMVAPFATAAPGPAAQTPAPQGLVAGVTQMLANGAFDGDARLLYYDTQNAYFTPDEDQRTATFGGRLGFTSAAFHGLSFRISGYGQHGIDHADDPARVEPSLAPNIAVLGQAYLQWAGDDVRVRAGNQTLNDVPFASGYDYRIIPQIYRGVSARIGNDDHYVRVLRMFRYKSRVNDDYDQTTNYNTNFVAYPPNTTRETGGFWAVGGGGKADVGPTALSGQAWFFNYRDYANMFYSDGEIARATGAIQPFVGAQFIRETETGAAVLGNIDHRTYGARAGVRHHSLTASLSYDYIPHEDNSVLDGALVTPYAHNVASGPYFAQPLLNSTQDLGSGNAYAIDIQGAPADHAFLGARYSYMDLRASAGADAIGQSEYLVFGSYTFQGALQGLSLRDAIAYQTRDTSSVDFWENRLTLGYSF